MGGNLGGPFLGPGAHGNGKPPNNQQRGREFNGKHPLKPQFTPWWHLRLANAGREGSNEHEHEHEHQSTPRSPQPAAPSTAGDWAGQSSPMVLVCICMKRNCAACCFCPPFSRLFGCLYLYICYLLSSYSYIAVATATAYLSIYTASLLATRC
jgi:hypothetical protein